MRQHESRSRGAKYLRGRSPLRLVYAAEVGDRVTAMRLEYRVKRLDRTNKEALISGRLALDELLPPPDQAAGTSGPNSSIGTPNSGR